MHSFSRNIFVAVVLLALPGYFWASFEMYGLTLLGSQMLFFSIVHTSLVLVYVVIAGFLFCLLWLLMTLAALLVERYRIRIGTPKRALAIFLVAISAHFLLLVTYEYWANSFARVLICVMGLSLAGLNVSQVRKTFFSKRSIDVAESLPNNSIERSR